ncbi:haloacid dehalogenase-like hydrolase family protein [Cladophialophora carrionii]|uniref:Haloacid dehalogenase-like hydrolase family protein n=1 Tax=Cladophialophora carrionii TaxID=86049 RepID=A0A1C1CGU1_9EURO|nr:haloacid dehalogenase-like hydrolase family protein [Cladophialophora carrionii]
MSAPISASPSEKATRRKPKRFAPLNPDIQHGRDLPRLKGTIFDVDGTLCLPQNYMFKEMRQALGIPRSVDILDHIRSLSNEPDGNPPSSNDSTNSKGTPQSSTDTSQPPSADLLSPSLPDTTTDISSDEGTAPSPASQLSSPQSRAVATIQSIERRAMTSQRPQPGLQSLMSYLQRRNVRKGLCTRNFPAPVHHLLDSFLQGEEFGTFEPIITRDSEGVAPKPSPEGLWRIAEHWGLPTEDEGGLVEYIKANSEGGEGELDPLELAKRYLGSGLIMVGDSIDDMAAGYRAGAATVLLVNDENQSLARHEYTGRTVQRLDELIGILENGFSEDA